VLLCIKLAGPVAVNISGTLKDVVLTYVGFMFFDDVKMTTPVLVGLVFSFGGAAYISYTKAAEANAQKTANYIDKVRAEQEKKKKK